MKLSVIWFSAFKSILNNRRRSLLTMLGIVIGISSVIAIMSIGNGYKNETMKNLTNDEGGKASIFLHFIPKDENLVGNTNITFFTDMDIRILKLIEGVNEISFPKIGDTAISKEIAIKNNIENLSIQVTKESKKKIMEGRNISEEDHLVCNKVLVIDNKWAEKMYGATSNALNRGLYIEGEVFKIVGVFSDEGLKDNFSVDNADVFIPKNTFLTYFQVDDKASMKLNIILDKDVIPNEIATEIISVLKKDGSMHNAGFYEVFDSAIVSENIGKLIDGLTYFISAIAAISLLIAGIGIMNMMYISVSERTKEIGIRRALGATENSIRLQFLLEGVSITLIGGVFGYLLGLLFAFCLTLLLPFPIAIDLFSILLAISLSIIIGIIFSVVPASKAAKKDLVDILH